MENKPNTASEKKTFAVTNGIGIVGNTVTFIPPAPIAQIDETKIKRLESDFRNFRSTTPALIKASVEEAVSGSDLKFVKNGGNVTEIVALTESEYRSLSSVQPTVLYIIV